jgi:hypothetical protein
MILKEESNGASGAPSDFQGSTRRNLPEGSNRRKEQKSRFLDEYQQDALGTETHGCQKRLG